MGGKYCLFVWLFHSSISVFVVLVVCVVVEKLLFLFVGWLFVCLGVSDQMVHNISPT